MVRKMSCRKELYSVVVSYDVSRKNASFHNQFCRFNLVAPLRTEWQEALPALSDCKPIIN